MCDEIIEAIVLENIFPEPENPAGNPANRVQRACDQIKGDSIPSPYLELYNA